jgi:uncharacterized membrane protein YdjX (TVP38/TMEM64 family)
MASQPMLPSLEATGLHAERSCDAPCKDRRAPASMSHPPVVPTNDAALHQWVWRRAVLLIVLCLVLALVVATAPLHEALMEALAILESAIRAYPLMGALLFVLFAAVSAMVTFVSVAIVVPAASLTWGVQLSIVLLWVGWLLGGAAAYGIGRYLGRPVVHWLIANDALARFEARVRRDAPFVLVLLLQLALPSEIPGYALGLVRYSFPRYLLALAIAELPYTIAAVLLGAGFVAGHGGVIFAVGGFLAGLSVVAFLLLRRMTDRRAQA